MARDDDEIAPPRSERYRIGPVIGRGGMGVVYEAFDEARGERVALKTLRALDRDALLLFKREFRALADLRHPNLVSLGELVFEGGTWFFTMELLTGHDFRRFVRGATDGPTLAAPTPTVRVLEATPTVPDHADAPRLREARPRGIHSFDEARLRSAVAGVAEGLSVVHEAGRAHLDVKPSNVRLTDDGRAVLLDFGLAGASAVVASRPNHVMGTPEYMAPEQAMGVIGPECDLYAVGVMLYEALTGGLPFDGSAVEILSAKVRSDPMPLALVAPGAPSDLADLTAELLSRDPSARPTARGIAARVRGGARPSEVPTRPSFVGRAAELSVLEAALSEVGEGSAVVVTIEGEPGLGKSALAAEFAERARRSGRARVLFGRCYEHESVPYKAFDAIVDELSVWLAAGSDRALRLAPHLAAAARIFPVLHEGSPEGSRTGDDVEARRLGFSGLRAVLSDVARERPLILVLDDVQWGDDDSARLAEELLDPLEAPPLMILATQRPVATPNALLSALRGSRSTSRHHLPLTPLSTPDAELAAVLLGATAAGAAALAKSSLGNPLLLGELWRHVAAGGTSDESVDVTTSLLGRVAALPTAARRLLEMVAIAGRPTSEGLLARASALDGETRDAVDALLRAGLVKRGGSRSPDALEASHDRVREAVSGALEPATARRLHAALAVALAAAPEPEADALAEHLAQAGDAVAAARWARSAADACDRALAFGRAVRFHQLALADPSMDATERRARSIKLGHALASAGRGREAADVFLAASVGASATQSVALRQRAAEQLLITGHMGEGKRVLGEVLRDVGIFAPPGLSTSLPMFMLERGRLAARGLDCRFRPEADVPERDLVRVDACLAAARALSIIDTMQGAYFQLRQLRMALDAGEPMRIIYGLALSAGFLAAAEGTRGEAALRRIDVAEARSRGVPNPRCEAFLDMARGVVAYCRGDFAQATRWGREAAAVLETRCTDVTWDLSVSRVFVGLGLAFSGELAVLERDLRGWLKDATARGDLYLSSHLRMTCAPWLHLARGDAAAARAELDGASAEWPHRGFSWAAYYVHLHRALLALYEGDPDGAGRAIAEHGVFPCPLYLSSFVMHRLLARWAAGAVAAARFGRSGSTRDRDRVAEAVRAVRREREPWAAGLASSLEAALLVRTDRRAAVDTLDRASHELGGAGLWLFADAAAHEAARLDDSHRTPSPLDVARERLARRGVADPARFARALIPGVS